FVALLGAPSPSAAVVAVTAQSNDRSRVATLAMEEAADALRQEGFTPLMGAEVVEAFEADPRVQWILPEPAGELGLAELAREHKRAARLEANFNTAQALVIWHALLAKIYTAGPNPELLILGIEVAHDAAAAQLGSNET